MVLHLPGSMSIMALITLSKESISLFSFLLHAPEQRHRRKLKGSSNAVRSACYRHLYLFPVRPTHNSWGGLPTLQSIIQSHLFPFTLNMESDQRAQNIVRNLSPNNYMFQMAAKTRHPPQETACRTLHQPSMNVWYMRRTYTHSTLWPNCEHT